MENHSQGWFVHMPPAHWLVETGPMFTRLSPAGRRGDPVGARLLRRWDPARAARAAARRLERAARHRLQVPQAFQRLRTYLRNQS